MVAAQNGTVLLSEPVFGQVLCIDMIVKGGLIRKSITIARQSRPELA
jgi:hypothetical protein